MFAGLIMRVKPLNIGQSLKNFDQNISQKHMRKLLVTQFCMLVQLKNDFSQSKIVR